MTDNKPDSLGLLFQLQRNYGGHGHKTKGKFPSKEYPYDRIAGLAVAAIHELVELRNETNWKWWKKSKKENRKKIEFELIDVLHFWISMALELGWDYNDVVSVYMSKYEINKQLGKVQFNEVKQHG